MKKRGIRLSLCVIVISLLGLNCTNDSTTVYSGSSGFVGNAPPNTVTMSSMSFYPTSLTVSKGTTVTWQNNDNVTHTATSDTASWDSGTILSGASKSVIFNNSGTFPYHCAIHTMMRASIVVQ